MLDKSDDFISQMSKKGYKKLLSPKNKPPFSSPSRLTEFALKKISGGAQCQDCIYLSFNKSIGN